MSSTNQGSSFSGSANLVRSAFNPPPPAIPFKVLSRENPAPLVGNKTVNCLEKFHSEYKKKEKG